MKDGERQGEKEGGGGGGGDQEEEERVRGAESNRGRLLGGCRWRRGVTRVLEACESERHVSACVRVVSERLLRKRKRGREVLQP
jgi:hypothetical protein